MLMKESPPRFLQQSRKLRGGEIASGNSLPVVCARELGVTLDKRLRMSDWAQRPLGVEQVEVAALEAEVLFRVWEGMREVDR